MRPSVVGTPGYLLVMNGGDHMRVVVQQFGARMDYAVPRALYAEGELAALVTDLYFERPPKPASLARYSSPIPLSLVSRSNIKGLAYRALLSRTSLRMWPHLREAEDIADRTVDAVVATGAAMVYGFDAALLPVMERLQFHGVGIVMEQCVAPRAQFTRAMRRLTVKLEKQGLDVRTSGLEESWSYSSVMSALEREEWRRAGKIYCPSQFVANELCAEGVSADKVRIIPYGVTLPPIGERPLKNSDSALTVTFGGAFSWRKGALEFGRAASLLKGRAAFEACGRLAIDRAVAKRVAPDVYLHGHLSKRDFLRRLVRSDVFVLPSYTEGSATVIYEAMALGLPCVVTRQCGSVITHNRDGLIVDAGDEGGLVEALDRLLTDHEFRREVGYQASLTARQYTRESYGRRVRDALKSDLPSIGPW